EGLTAEVVGPEALLLEPRPGGPVVDHDTLANQVQELALHEGDGTGPPSRGPLGLQLSPSAELRSSGGDRHRWRAVGTGDRHQYGTRCQQTVTVTRCQAGGGRARGGLPSPGPSAGPTVAAWQRPTGAPLPSSRPVSTASSPGHRPLDGTSRMRTCAPCAIGG